jgi:hypothetical protein
VLHFDDRYCVGESVASSSRTCAFFSGIIATDYLPLGDQPADPTGQLFETKT